MTTIKNRSCSMNKNSHFTQFPRYLKVTKYTRHMYFIFFVYIHALLVLMYYFHEHYYLWLFCFHLENVGECCKVQWVCVHQRTVLYKSYLLLLSLLKFLDFNILSTAHRVASGWMFIKVSKFLDFSVPSSAHGHPRTIFG